MKKPLLALAFACLAATPALAQINMAWRNCITVTSGTSAARANENSFCDGVNQPGPFKGVISFIAPPNVTDFIAVQITLDIQTASPVLPDFWRMGVGECREGSFVAPVTLTGIGSGTTGTCQNPYAGANTGGGYSYASGVPCADHATVTLTMFRDTPRPLTAGQQYIAEAFLMDGVNGLDVCTGCEAPATLTARQIEIQQVSPASSHLLTGYDLRNYIAWQGGAVLLTCYEPVSARNRTWGAIKATYR